MASSTLASKRVTAAAALLALALASRVAFAQPTDAALAETLFRDGKALLDARKYAEACPKLAESQRLDPGSGTMLALALCYESAGKFASAWAAYTEAATLARAAGRADRESAAKKKAADLEPKLSRLTIAVPPASRVEGLEIKRDGVSLREASWGSAVPMDPGDHPIEVTAPGRKAWTTKVTIRAAGDTQTVNVPALEAAPAGAAAAPATAPPSSTAPPADAGAQPDTTKRWVGIAVGGVGVVALGVGTIFGVTAMGDASQANKLCPSSPCADATGLKKNADAKSAALISDITLGAGLAAVGVGVVLIVTSRGASTAAARGSLPLDVAFDAHGASARFERTW